MKSFCVGHIRIRNANSGSTTHCLQEHIKLAHNAERFKCSFCDHIATTAQNKVGTVPTVQVGTFLGT